MGDLTRALVDLGTAAERRRSARSDLRDAVPTIVAELMRHLRAGDSFAIWRPSETEYPDHWATYRVERVTWSGTAEIPPHPDRLNPQPEVREHPRGASVLVRWPSERFPGADGAVLLDPREPWTEDDWDGLAERQIELEFKPDRSPTGLRLRNAEWEAGGIHLATDEELIEFAEEAEEVISGFAQQFARDADLMKSAVTSTSQYRPR